MNMPGLMLYSAGNSRKRRYLMRALAAGYPGHVMRPGELLKPVDILATWGWAPEQQVRVIAHPGPSLVFDYSYFCRSQGESHYCRVGLGSPFPPNLPPAPPDRFASFGVTVESLGDPAGPFIIIGMGRKARRSWRLPAMRWEVATARKIRKLWPGRKILYRPKRANTKHIPGVETISPKIPIREAITGAALVLCQHSNVAVDCAQYGVAASCAGGAGRFISSETMDIKIPSLSDRRAFCERLAWWQWHTEEIEKGDCWSWLLEQISQV